MILLIMLTLMILFAVLGVTYVLVSSQFRRTSLVVPRIDQYTPDYRKQLDEAMMQVVRGPSSNTPAANSGAPTSTMSVIGPHSLLEDIYGNDAVASSSTSFTTASTANPPSGGTATPITISLAKSALVSTPGGQTPTASQIQLVDLSLGGPAPLNGALPWPLASNAATYSSALTYQTATSFSGPKGLLSPYYGITDPSGAATQTGPAPSGFFNGCVLTFLTGPAAGQSTRIIGYDNGIQTVNGIGGGPGTTNSNTGGVPTLRVVGFPGATAMINQSGAGSSNTWQFLINGRPFNGTGFGFNLATNLVDAADGTSSGPPNTRLFALLPNPVYFLNNNSPTASPLNPLASYLYAGGIGGADEDYDTADWNNMLLGLPLDPRDVTATIPAPAAPYPNYPPYPSLHRPELVSYWVNTASGGKDTSWLTFLTDTSTSYLPLARQISMRPIGYFPGCTVATTDHPNFTGSNSNTNGFDAINGPWDVDNDGDGVADSIWVDLGLPIHTAADGTTYKPLFAIRVLDLDGRLNVNAHGSSAQLETAYANPNSVTAKFANSSIVNNTGTPTNTITPSTVTSGNVSTPTIGSGNGTAEINLTGLYTQQSSPGATYQNLLAGGSVTVNGTTVTYEGRYGELNTTSAATNSTTHYDSTVEPSVKPPGSSSSFAYAGNTNSNGSEAQASVPGFIKRWEYPIPLSPDVLTGYGTAPDLWGRAFTALDIGGAPLMPSMSAINFQSSVGGMTPSWNGGLGGQFDAVNTPYDLNLSRMAVRGSLSTGAIDNPFTPAELERLLRPNDTDASTLAPRLAALLGPSTTAALTALRRQVTTDSFDLPSPNLLTTDTYAANANAYLLSQSQPISAFPFASSAVDLLQLQLIGNNFYQNQSIVGEVNWTPDPMLTTGGAHIAWNTLSAQMQLMLPPELLDGQRFDINRPFGNGRDDDGDGVVDEPDEYGLGEPAWVTNATTTGAGQPPNSGNCPIPGMPTGSGNAVNLAIDWNGDGTINSADALMVRHLMARYLYVLAMTSVDPTVLQTGIQQTAIQYDAGGTANPSAETGGTNPVNVFQVEFALAQWAINCVDFRDRDSTMTPFEFDRNPFNGWGVDGVLDDGSGTVSKDDTSGERCLVWGCERPELLITETLAWHDRRTQDLPSVDSGIVNGPMGNKDTNNDFDQAVLPMPACFIELYNPWVTQYSTQSTTGGEQSNAPAAAEAAGEFYYDQNNPNSAYFPYGASNANYPTAKQPTGVVLNKVATDSTGKASPVWRLIFVNNGLYAGATQTLGPATIDARTVDPDDPVLPTYLPNFSSYIDRIAYFVAPPGAGYSATFPSTGTVFPSTSSTIYYPSSATVGTTGPATLKPGRYAVIGSYGGDNLSGLYFSKLGRSTNNVGSATDPNAGAPTGADTNPRQIVLAPKQPSSETNQVTVYNSGQIAPLPAEPAPILGGSSGQDAQNAIAIALDTAVTSGGTAGPRTFGISDPVGGYTNAVSATPNAAGEPVLVTAAPQPLDYTSGDRSLLINQTITGYRTVHLQRLANPQIPFNAISNPYLTIDSASVDVTAFNGIWNQTTDPNSGTGFSGAFASTQRGDQSALTGTPAMPPQLKNQSNVLWVREFGHTSPVTAGLANAGVLAQNQGSVASQVFTPVLHHSIGYLNQMYGLASVNANSPYTAAASTAYTSSNYAAPSAYLGMPTTPFPWLTWNNRPYTTPLELALVPKSRSSRLLSDFSLGPTSANSIYQSQSGGVILYPNSPGSGGAVVLSPAPAGGAGPFFNHLLNFFDTGSSMPSNLYRIFELLQTPSRFVGTDTMLSPNGSTGYGVSNAFGNPNSGPPAKPPSQLYGDYAPNTSPGWYGGNVPYTIGSSSLGTYVLPPLNKVSEYRDPGRVNINTVQDPVVWQGILNGLQFPLLTSTGSANVAGTVTTQANSNAPPAWGLNGMSGVQVPTTTPSYFTNPFRSFAGAGLTNSIYTSPGYTVTALDGSSVNPYLNGTSVFNSGGSPSALRDVDATFWRTSQIGSVTGNLLFEAQGLSGGTIQAYSDPTKSPLFRLQNVSRMSNLLTTRSNVYAVWITVGYFQVTPWYGPTVASPGPTSPVVYDTAHPDGFQLGQELGSDTGDIKRHRAFYMFDRSIPVGFERGIDHNVQNAIVLRRFIE